ncbi:MAG: YicC family protein [Clostridiales bacterium]|nr:YicC family protein [Clostridiales bacterium]
MIKSMTGYGRAQDTIDGIGVTVEIKSVNHRYFEFSARTPRNCGFLEDKLKTLVQSMVSRGKTECGVQLEIEADESMQVSLNTSLASGYISALEEIKKEFSLGGNVDASLVARFPDVLSVSKAPVDEEKIWNAVRTVAVQAVEAFIKMREIEGEKLRNDLISRADAILSDVEFVEKRSPETVKIYNDKLVARMKDLLGETTVDEQRLLTEAAIFADKIAVAEETVRLRSHLDQLREMVSGDEAIGRKLDFLVQEINREANTIGSKAQDVEIARHVINIKAEVEKIREQVQNIE